MLFSRLKYFNILNLVKKKIELYFSSLLLQVINLIFPLITIPFITESVGIEKYGIFALSQNILSFFVVIIDFGFNITATNKCVQALNSKEPDSLSIVFSETYSIKTYVLLFSLTSLTFLSYFYFLDYYDFLVIIFVGINLVGHFFLPIWFIYASKLTGIASIFNLASKLLTILFIKIIIHSPSDYIWINVLIGGFNLLYGVIVFIYCVRKFNIKISFIAYKSVVRIIRENTPIVISNFFANILFNSNSLIIFHFYGATIQGYYSIIERIVLILRSFIAVLSQTIYPMACYKKLISHFIVAQYLRSVFYFAFIVVGVIYILVYIFADDLIRYFLKSVDSNMIFYLRLFCLLPFVTLINFPFNQMMMIYNHTKGLSISISIGCGICPLLGYFLIPNLGIFGAILAFIIAEIIIVILLIYFQEFKYKFSSLFFFTGRKTL